ncbi:hypothetical protein KCP69_21590 [Salmonella enterica subsp. enterica]|nr:hypothetical protein KCP69_21590 [Salmonella enterica subsp. enterica]
MFWRQPASRRTSNENMNRRWCFTALSQMSVGMAFGTDMWRTLRGEVKASVSIGFYSPGWCWHWRSLPRFCIWRIPIALYNALINLRHARLSRGETWRHVVLAQRSVQRSPAKGHSDGSYRLRTPARACYWWRQGMTYAAPAMEVSLRIYQRVIFYGINRVWPRRFRC